MDFAADLQLKSKNFKYKSMDFLIVFLKINGFSIQVNRIPLKIYRFSSKITGFFMKS